MADFFRQQEEARGRTRLLVFLFGLAVLVVVGLTYLLNGLFTLWSGNVWAPSLTLCAAVAGGIGAASGLKILELSGGGSVVAKDLGGRPVDPGTRDADERKLLNVVEEMAIASGVPVPQVWVMDHESGINAFAAGHTPSDAVIGVTRGGIRALSRDELQGVIAHEFSHILNGDMKLNVRLMGVVYGILILAIIGRGMMRVAVEMRGGDGRENPRFILLALGGALVVTGYTGVLLGRLIKSAVSRQREFLADASAVQFTRNPAGIAGALMKIGGSGGSRLRSPQAEEASHMMFSNIFRGALFATHPPLARRIRAILPAWDGQFVKVTLDTPAAPGVLREGGEPESVSMAAPAVSASPGEIVARVGMLSPADMENAGRLRAALPEELLELLRDPGAAQAALFGLLASGNHGAGWATLASRVDESILHLARQVAEQTAPWHYSQTIALIDLAIPALRRLTLEEYEAFLSVLHDLMAHDGETAVFEFMMQRVIRRHLDRWFRPQPPPRIRFRHLNQVIEQLEVLLTALCGVGSRTPEGAKMALSAGQALLAQHGIPVILQPRPAGLDGISRALEELEAATPLLKKQLLTACFTVARADGVITAEEAELLRAMADSMGCPMPMLNEA